MSLKSRVLGIAAKLAPVAIPAVGIAAGMDFAGDVLNLTTFVTAITSNWVAILAMLTGTTIFWLVVAIKYFDRLVALVMKLVGYIGGGNKKA